MGLVSVRWQPGGVDTNVTSLVTGWSTTDYGVKRDDTGATVVNSGLAYTKTATGQYQKSWTDPANDLSYTYRYTLVYNGVTYRISGDVEGGSTATEVPLQYDDIYNDVSRYLGTGDSPTGTNLTRAKRIAQDAFREFLMGFIPGENTTYEWSFLDTPATLTISTGSTTTTLPASFESMSGPLAYGPSATAIAMRQVDPATIDQMFAAGGNASGNPIFYAVEAVGFSSGGTQQRRIKVYPVTGSTTTFYYSYRKTPDALSQEIMGQPTMHMAVKQLARATAAEQEDDINSDAQEERAKADRLMLAAIHLDARNKPQNLGYCGDNSDGRRWIFDRLGTATYEGES